MNTIALDRNQAGTAHYLSVAPMMEWTDRHCRMFHRLFAPHALLYTEMVTTGALLNGPRARLLEHSVEEHPVAFQIGGSDPDALAQCARFVEDAGFDELNLNVGCPSGRVQHGGIGACLMAEPERVAACVQAMQRSVVIPVTVKCRLGIDDRDDYEFLAHFVRTLADVGCRTVIVHARKAILSGLTPAQNRDIPPLDYTRVHRLKREFPSLEIVLNGGLGDTTSTLSHLDVVDGVMIGRAAYRNPWLLAELEAALFGTAPPASGRDVLQRYEPYVRRELERGTRLFDIARHLHGLFSGCRGAARYRRALSELPRLHDARMDALWSAASVVDESKEALCSNA